MTRSRQYPLTLPPARSGLAIGLYGGSFNPAHGGHRHVALTALKRLGLDRIWCLVTPGNPLKDTSGLPPLDARLAQTAEVMDHPRIDVTGIEARAGTHYTAETLEWLTRRAPDTRFVWIMGVDNLGQFHRWQRWQDIAQNVPIAIIDRPGYSFASLHAMAAHRFDYAQLPNHKARHLVSSPCPAWTVLYGPRSALSSTALRQISSQS